MSPEGPKPPRLVAFAIWLLGAWFALTVAMSFVAGGNFANLRTDRLRDADRVFAAIPSGEPRVQALRYVASELNRSYFLTYANLQIGIAAVVIAALVVAAPRRRALLALAGLAAASTIWFRFHLVPEITDLGRAIDFLPRDPKPEKVLAFDRLHHQAVIGEGAKMLLLLAAAVMAARRRPEAGRPRD